MVGNKADLFESENVTEDEAKEFAKSINAGFFLTSAKNNIQISELFVQSGRKFIDPNCNSETNNNDIMNNEEKNVRSNSIKINKVDKQEKHNCC